MAVTIFSLILTTALTFYAGSLQSWSRGLSTLDRQQNARIAMDEIIRELRYARSLEGFQDEGVLPLYSHKAEEQHGASRMRYLGVDGQRSELRFNEAKKIVTLKVTGGPPNEIAYNVVGLDFFRYIPQGGRPEENSQGTCPMLLVCIKLQGKALGPRQGAPYILQSVVRLQNLPLSVE